MYESTEYIICPVCDTKIYIKKIIAKTIDIYYFI